MAYSTSNPPVLLVSSFDNTPGFPNIWVYSSTELGSAVDALAYFTNADKLGMKVGDVVLVYATGVKGMTSHILAATGSTTADLGDGTTFGSTVNSD